MTAHSKPLAALIILCLLSGCTALGLMRNPDRLKEPKVSLAGLAVKNLDLFAPSFLVHLRVENPNDLEVNLDGADVALALNGRPVATGINRGPLSLAKFGASDMTVEVSASTMDVLQQVLLLQSKPMLDYEVTGHLNVLNWLGPLGRLPFSFQGAVDRETLLQGAESLGARVNKPASSGPRPGAAPAR
jgi:hypothetical protein